MDEPLTMERDGNTYYYHRDGLGSITEITDESGVIVERYEYDVYGAVTIFDGNGITLTASAIGNPYLFTARRYDSESGNYYYRARYYSPSLGRFLSQDPLGFEAGDYNLYRYAFNSPTNLTDPTGKITPDIVIDILAFGLDILFAVVPVATGGGPGLRFAVAGANVSVDAVRVPVAAEKLLRRGTQWVVKGTQIGQTVWLAKDSGGDGGNQGPGKWGARRGGARGAEYERQVREHLGGPSNKNYYYKGVAYDAWNANAQAFVDAKDARGDWFTGLLDPRIARIRENQILKDARRQVKKAGSYGVEW